MKKKNKFRKSTRIPWHPAFVQAIQLELDDYRDSLEFYPEYQLTAEPLKIDCVIIKKTKNVEIKKNFAAIFKEWNILEYKSPEDYVSVNDFYKVYGYVCLYTFLNEIPITDLTITFIESHYPRKLLKHLAKTRGYRVAKTGAGIYTVYGDVIPIQVIDSRKLSSEDNVWLKNLSNRLDLSAFRQINDEIGQLEKTERVMAYFDAILRANTKAIKEIEDMSKLPKHVEEMMERTGLAARLEARAEAREREKWQSVVADKDAVISQLHAQITELQAKIK